MPDFYLIAVGLLFTLAIVDLVVGVSNDAVNFLNSAIGAKAAPRWGIMVVASCGIFLGASFSSGMMEVARKGVFDPQMLSFADVMAIFLAVMLTDIILLDLFNTWGMPTSTTVSIVFELLGGTVVVSMIKLAAAETGTLADYVNSANALRIISGIFLAVGIAFTIGTVVQFLSRLFFTFREPATKRWVAIGWSTVALTAMILFLLVKGLRGASFLSEGGALATWYHDWWQARPLVTGGLVAVGVFVLTVILDFLRVNVLRLTVLVGTFALAMAFAGNDLVNFIGVPIAGYQSYKAWSVAETAPEDFSVRFLSERVATEPLLLFLAGGIMVVTLWVSKKARSVTETEVNLGRQSSGAERFQPNALSRAITGAALWMGRVLHITVPMKVQGWIERQFAQVGDYHMDIDLKEAPAFDLVRASVNLTVASVLIALATSYKMPLSTTYVSFMVAMGTSLADRAWGRESAVYRVSGVLHVIGGWFLTAIIAFTVAGFFAWIIFHTHVFGVAAITALAAWAIYHSFHAHGRRSKEAAASRSSQWLSSMDQIDFWQHRRDDVVARCCSAVEEAVIGVANGKERQTREAVRSMRLLELDHRQVGGDLITWFGRAQEDPRKQVYLDAYSGEAEVVEEAVALSGFCHDYLVNFQPPVTSPILELLRSSVERVLGERDGEWESARLPELSKDPVGSRAQIRLMLEVDRRLRSLRESVKRLREHALT